MSIPVIAIFDIGKTNKKFFLFSEQYHIVHERSEHFAETVDEDGFPCDDVHALSEWVSSTLKDAMSLPGFSIRAVNVSAYGASFVHLDEKGQPVGALYNYLNPYPAEIQVAFYEKYGGEIAFSLTTASPVLGNLNSGLQLYRLLNQKPALFEKIHYSLHLPQYISYLISGKPAAEITSIGCHTALWNFAEKQYHQWVYEEGIDVKFPPVLRSDAALDCIVQQKKIKCGIGLHDSSAALVPYLSSFSEPFLLISTGTWCISLNPFNSEPLTATELEQDCLCYLEYHRKPVKASRVFAGNEHEVQVKKLASYFNVKEDFYTTVEFDQAIYQQLENKHLNEQPDTTLLQVSVFGSRSFASFSSLTEAYHQLIFDIMQQQKKSTTLVLSQNPPSRIFVDGGFARNPLYMNMLAHAFPRMEVYAASVSQASAMGAALAIHREWNSKPVPGDMVDLKYYTIAR
jgi:sugar (pentulose or hexulose) kinase